MHKIAYILAGLGLLLAACEPYQAEDISLPAAPSAEFSFSPMPDDPNRLVVTDNSGEGFVRLWDFGNGSNSSAEVDTVFYPLAGEYTITLAVSGQGGTSVAEQTVTIEQDAALSCDSTLTNLLGGCTSADSKTWVFSLESGAISIGPEPLSSQYFSSSENGLVPEQYNDSWTFNFEGSGFLYENEGLTVDPAQDYEAVPYTPPADATWRIEPEAGFGGSPRLTLSPEESFLGVKDSGPVYDLHEVTEDRMVLVGQLRSDPNVYFTLYFVAQ